MKKKNNETEQANWRKCSLYTHCTSETYRHFHTENVLIINLFKTMYDVLTMVHLDDDTMFMCMTSYFSLFVLFHSWCFFFLSSYAIVDYNNFENRCHNVLWWYFWKEIFTFLFNRMQWNAKMQHNIQADHSKTEKIRKKEQFSRFFLVGCCRLLNTCSEIYVLKPRQMSIDFHLVFKLGVMHCFILLLPGIVGGLYVSVVACVCVLFQTSI